MCRDVIIDGTLCGTHGELKAEIGGDPIYQPGITEGEDDDCLCGIDVDATAKQFGLTVDRDLSHDGETIMFRGSSLEQPCKCGRKTVAWCLANSCHKAASDDITQAKE